MVSGDQLTTIANPGEPVWAPPGAPSCGRISRLENVLQKPTDGAQLPAEPAPRRPYRDTVTARFNQRSVRFARGTQAWFADHAGAPVGSASSAVRSALRPFACPERSLPIAVAAIVAVASMLALMPGQTTNAVGSVSGRGQDIRLAVNGGLGRPAEDLVDAPQLGEVDAKVGGDAMSFAPVVIPKDVDTAARVDQSSTQAVDFLDDGTILTGYAPETSVEDGADLIRRYKVKSGDTLVTIARKFDVSMKTVWWANKLTSKDDLHIGQVLRIPPVSGLVVTVKDTDTLESLAQQHGVDAQAILELNGLDDPTLVVDQVLVLPGAKGAPIPTQKPTPKPAAKPHAASSSGGHSAKTSSKPRSGGASYNGGQFRWPVVGGGNYVSQYFHAGHGAVDIAGDYGSPVVAAAGGRVVFAGWKSNGGGWQVWISHGGGLYTTYNHMSGVAVGTGQSVGRGQRVGRLGQSGRATGPHLHFEVWRGGMPWRGGSQINPMHFF
jgi:murein DD-endopeptidase MepM/ murein hydrolase activator NlpD